ncbi:hypothetical protein [Paenibacillus sp. 32352]|uniref:hypothetical protein n=1 Tax=Paenibacillus sp. 32352 TaxID=1969111 RepID=UPI0009AE008E|nr:hypothetical protein [Paenibacillus sp. 32352]
MKLGYVRARTKKEIDAFIEQAQPDKLYVDLADEFGASKGLQLAEMLEMVKANDTIIVRGFIQLADDIGQLSRLLSTLNSIGSNLTILDEDDGGLLLDDHSLKVVDYLDKFTAAKEEIVSTRESKVGRKALEYPSNFYDVYKDYRFGDMKADTAYRALGLKYRAKFYELIRMFEA